MTDEPQLPAGAYSEGALSFAQGLPRDNCPYPPGAGEREDWLRGWDEAAKGSDPPSRLPP